MDSPEAAGLGLPTSFTIDLPPEWIEIDPDPAGRLERIRDQVQQVADLQGLDDGQRRSLEAALRSAMAEAWDVGVQLAAAYAEVEPPELDDDGSIPANAPEPVLLMATLSVALLETGQHGLSTDFVDQIFVNDGGASLDRAVTTVDLAAGPAVKVRESRTIQPTDWPEPGAFVVSQYYVPAGGANGLAVLTFMTPTLLLADAFDALFDVMAESFDWIWDRADA